MDATLVGGELRSVNPATLEVVGAVAVTPLEAVTEAVTEARLAQQQWARTSFAERRALLAAVARLLLERMDEIAATVTAETAKPLVEAFLSDVMVAVDNTVWIAENAEPTLCAERLRYPQLYLKHKRGRIEHVPLGAVAVISPWNFPFAIPYTETAMAVAAGNAVLVKPSELTPLSGAWVERVFEEAGAPKGLVRVLQGDGELGGALVRARGIAKVFFTGSTEVGRKIAAAAGERLCPVTLELGGKDPMLVFADADVERALDGAAWGSFFNCGQVCSGIERIFVEEPLHDRFVSGLAERAKALRIGRGDDFDSDLGPLISEEQRAKVEALVETAREGVVTGGARPETGLPGWFYEPTVIAGSSDELRREEIFGPVVTVEPFASEEEAVRLANDTRYGLGASVWTRDAERARRVAGRLEAGSVWTNDVAYTYAAGQTPWGGFKESGLGRTHSRHGFYACTQVRFVEEDSGRLAVPWWFPYDELAVDGFKGVLGALYGQGMATKAGAAWRHRRGLVHLGKRYLR